MANFCSKCGKPVQENTDFCTSCGASLTGKAPAKANWQEKRERVLGKQQSSDKSRLRTIIIVGIVAAFGGWFYVNLPESGNPIIKASPVVVSPVIYTQAGEQMFDVPSKVQNGKIIIPLDLLKERKFLAFNYTTERNNVPLLAYITGEGKILTAVSMCEPCNSIRFHIKGDKLICNSCGSTWELNNLEAVSGSCGRFPPDAVPNTIVGNEIQIEEGVVANWQRRI